MGAGGLINYATDPRYDRSIKVPRLVVGKEEIPPAFYH